MTGNSKTVPIALNRAQLLGFDQTSGIAVGRSLAAKVGVKTVIHFGPASSLSLAAPIEPIDLDWSCLLGFDQASQPDGDRRMRHGAKVGDKFSIAVSGGTLGPKIGPKEARGFGDCVGRLGAKVGSKIGLKPKGLERT
jgi:hypothetical protein